MNKMTRKEAARVAELTGPKLDASIASEICREKSGRYGVGLEAMCKCGRTKGEHLAVAPWPADDTSDDLPDCDGFRKA